MRSPVLRLFAMATLVVLTTAPAERPEATRDWSVAVPGRGRPVLDEHGAYFLTKQHEVVAAERATGRVRWRAGTGEPGDETLGSSLAIAGDVVAAGDYDVIGFDIATGRRRWRFAPALGYGPGLYLAAASTEGMLFAGSPSGRAYAIRAADGTQAWSATVVPAERSTVFQPVLADRAVIAGYTVFGAGATGGVVSIDAATGREEWRHPFPRGADRPWTGFSGGPLVAADEVIAASGDGRIHAFDRRNGALRWTLPPVTRPDGIEQSRDWRALGLAGNLLVAGSASGRLIAWDLATRAERWRYSHPEGGSIAMQIVADQETVYVPHLGGLLVAVDARTGHERWSAGGWDDGLNWAPAVEGKEVYLAASKAGLLRLRPPRSEPPDR